jgi:hypothetical protein
VNSFVPAKGDALRNAPFKGFLVKVLQADPQQLANIADYQIPHSELQSTIFHILHWPPKPPPGSANPVPTSAPAKFRFNSYSLRVVTSLFPNAYEKHLFHDYFYRQVEIRGPDGKRLTNEQLYGRDKLLQLHEDVMADLIEYSTSQVLVVWGGPARRWFKKRFHIVYPARPEMAGAAPLWAVKLAIVGYCISIQLLLTRA